MSGGRPFKEGIDYFPLDTNTDKDTNLFFIQAKHGLLGFAIVIRLYQKIYSQGYFLLWDEKEEIVFSAKNNIEVNVCRNVVNDCINYGLFNKNVFEKYKILTSRGIQKRYFNIIDRRMKINFYPEIALIGVNDNKNLINVNINSVIADNKSVSANYDEKMSAKTTQIKLNKIKLNKNILCQIETEKKKFTISKAAVESFINVSASQNKTGIVGDPRKLSLLCQLGVVLTETGDETVFRDALLEMTGKGIANINYLKQVIKTNQKKGGSNSGRSSTSKQNVVGKAGGPEEETGKYARTTETIYND